jgi:dihydrofolate reductase
LGSLVYAAIASLDGYIADETGRFDWAEPDEEVHAFANELERPIGTHLYGRRLYEVMVVWETLDDPAPLLQDYAAIWRGTDKVVYSTTLTDVASARTRLERRFDPDAVRRMKAEAPTDLAIGGAALAAHAFRAGLVDECHLLLNPVIVGGGTRALPDDVRLDLELLDVRRFGNGVVHLHHRVRPS